MDIAFLPGQEVFLLLFLQDIGANGSRGSTGLKEMTGKSERFYGDFMINGGGRRCLVMYLRSCEGRLLDVMHDRN